MLQKQGHHFVTHTKVLPSHDNKAGELVCSWNLSYSASTFVPLREHCEGTT